MDSLLFVRLVKGLIFACNTYNVKPELMTLKMLKYSNRQTGFSYPIQANRLAIIVYCLRLGLNLKSQFPSLGDSCMCWYSGVCLASPQVLNQGQALKARVFIIIFRFHIFGG